MEIILLVIIAVTLSMDAFSLSLAYGTIGLDKKNIILLSCIVGIYHFIMPQIGNLFGILILKIIKIEPNIIIALIFTIIGIQMIIELFKEEKETFPLKISQMILFGFAVSIDSFSVGIGLNAITNKNILASSIFSALFANKLPGAGCIYLKFENKFLRPIYLNEKVIFKVEIIDILQEKKRVIFKTVAVSNDQECIMGMAELYIPE